MDKIEDIWNEDGKLQSDIVMNYCNILRDGRRNLEDKVHALGKRSAATKGCDQREQNHSDSETTNRAELINRQRAISREVRKQLDELDALSKTRKASNSSSKRGSRIFSSNALSRRSPRTKLRRQIAEDHLDRWRRYNLARKNKVKTSLQSYSHCRRRVMSTVLMVWRGILAERDIIGTKTRRIREKCEKRELKTVLHRWLDHTCIARSIRRIKMIQYKWDKSMAFEAWKRSTILDISVQKFYAKKRRLRKAFVLTEWSRIIQIQHIIERFKNRRRHALVLMMWNIWMNARLQRREIVIKMHNVQLSQCRRTFWAVIKVWFTFTCKSTSLQKLSCQEQVSTTLRVLYAWKNAYHNRLQIRNDYIVKLGRLRKKWTQNVFERWITYHFISQQRAKSFSYLIRKEITRSACHELIVAGRQSRHRQCQILCKKATCYLREWKSFAMKYAKIHALAEVLYHRQRQVLLKDTAWNSWQDAFQAHQQAHSADQHYDITLRSKAWKALIITLSRQIAIERGCHLLTQMSKQRGISRGITTWSRYTQNSKEQRKLLNYADDIHVDSLIVKGFYRWEVHMKRERERELNRNYTTRIFLRVRFRRWRDNMTIQKLHLEKVTGCIVCRNNRNTLLNVLWYWSRMYHERQLMRVKKWLYCWKHSCRQHRGASLLREIRARWDCREFWHKWREFSLRRIAINDLAHQLWQERTLHSKKISMQKWRTITLLRHLGSSKIRRVYREQKLKQTFLKWKKYTEILQGIRKTHMKRKMMMVRGYLCYWHETIIGLQARSIKFHRMCQQRLYLTQWQRITQYKNRMWHIHGMILSSQVGNAVYKWCEYTLQHKRRRIVAIDNTDVARRFLLRRLLRTWKKKVAHGKQLKRILASHRSQALRSVMQMWREKYYVCQIVVQTHKKYTRHLLLQTWISWVALTKRRKVAMSLLHHIYISLTINSVFSAWKCYHAHLLQVKLVLGLRNFDQKHRMARKSIHIWSNHVRHSLRVNSFVVRRQWRQLSQWFYRCTIFAKLMRADRRRKFYLMHRVFWLGFRRYTIWMQLSYYLHIKHVLLLERSFFFAWRNHHKRHIVTFRQLRQIENCSRYHLFMAWRRLHQNRKEEARSFHLHQTSSSTAFREARKLQMALSHQRMCLQ